MSKSGATRLVSVAAVVVVVAVVLWQLSESSAGRSKAPTSAVAPEVAVPAPVAPRPASSRAVVAPPAPSPSAPALAKIGGPDAHRPSGPAELTESVLMARLRKARASGRHALAIQLAREGNRRFPDSTYAPERHSILVHSLADNEQRSEARGEAEYMVNHYPDSDWVREIERFTGAHRHRNVRLNDAGEIEYY